MKTEAHERLRRRMTAHPIDAPVTMTRIISGPVLPAAGCDVASSVIWVCGTGDAALDDVQESSAAHVLEQPSPEILLPSSQSSSFSSLPFPQDVDATEGADDRGETSDWELWKEVLADDASELDPASLALLLPSFPLTSGSEGAVTPSHAKHGDAVRAAQRCPPAAQYA